MELTGQNWVLDLFPALFMASLCLCLLVYSYVFHEHDFVNPITYFVVFELVLMGLFSFFSSIIRQNGFGVAPELVSKVVYLHAVYGLIVAISYFSSKNPLRRIFSSVLKNLGIRPVSIGARMGFKMVLVVCGLAAFLLLIRSDPFLWITSPRDAYITLRSGFGVWWVLYQACIVIGLMISLHKMHGTKRKMLSLMVAVGAAMSMMYFTGSKTAILLIPITATIYYHFHWGKLPISRLLVLGGMVVGAFSILLGENGEDGNFQGLIRYFSDYVPVTALAVDLIDSNGYLFGESFLTSFWYFVPRSLFPEKPYEYGIVLLHGQLFPGGAELGQTPGILSWLGFYMDFGVIGLIIYGLVLGSFSRSVYLEFIRTHDLGSFILMISFCFVSPIASGSSVLFILLSMVLWLIFGKSGSFETHRNLRRHSGE